MQIMADFYCHLAFEIRFTKQRISLKKLADSGRFLYEIVSIVHTTLICSWEVSMITACNFFHVGNHCFRLTRW